MSGVHRCLCFLTLRFYEVMNVNVTNAVTYILYTSLKADLCWVRSEFYKKLLSIPEGYPCVKINNSSLSQKNGSM